MVDENKQSVIIYNETKPIEESSAFVELTNLLQQIDINGNTLLHMSCCVGNQSDTKILQILERYPLAAKQPNNYGCYPFHLASHFGASQNVLTKLIEIFPDVVALKDVKDQNIIDSISYNCEQENIDSGK